MSIDVYGAIQRFAKGLALSVGVTNVHDTVPTKAQLTAEALAQAGVAALAEVPDGFTFIVNDAAGGVNAYLCFKTDLPAAELFFLKFTKSA